jgi:hypothetical protein
MIYHFPYIFINNHCLISYMVVWSKIFPLVAVGAMVLFLGNVIARPAEASQSAAALTSAGTGLGTSLSSIGRGIGDLGVGTGTGLSGLLKPVWEFKNIVYGESTKVPGAANSSAVAQSDAGGAGRTGSNTITWSSGSSATVPSLSSAAKSHYSSLGVKVS